MQKLSRLLVVGLITLTVFGALGGGAQPAAARDKDKARARAERALREGEFEAAEKTYRELLVKDARDVDARLGLSYTLYKKRNLRDAYDNAARVLAVDPMSARAHALLGSALLSAGDFVLAIEEFRTALSFKQDEALSIAGLSMIHFYENRPQIALIGLRRALEIEPDEPDFIFNYAQSAARSERYREAADAYERFLRIAPRTDADRRARIRGLIEFLRYLGAHSDLYETSGAERAVIPFELSNSRPIIRVHVNGSKLPLRFVVDTGSGMCVISNAAAQKLGLRPVARGGLARAVGGGGRFEIVYGYLTSLQLGETRIENVPVYLREFHNAQEPVDGYVGLSVLAKYLASIDYGKREIMLVRDEQPRLPPQPAAPAATDQSGAPPAPQPTPLPEGVFELPIRSTSGGFWSSAIQIEGVEKPLNFIVDTGASISVVATALTLREDMARFVQPNRLRVYGAAGVSEDVQLLLLPRVSLGTYKHANLSAAVLDMEPINETSGFEQNGIIGGNILRFFRVTFDFQRALVRLESLNNFPLTPAPARDASVATQPPVEVP